ncbi:MAG TPA: chromate efflux transporter [Paracoccaceae bacterium]|nr:chromate efflux transporter [Paracoccaceae bacterium]
MGKNSIIPHHSEAVTAGPAPVSFRETIPVYVRIGLLSFGGPAGQIALMHEEIVAKRGWADEPGFQRGLNVAMILPGPEAQQLATYLGWRLHGLAGGLASGLAFILPGAFLMLALAWGAAAFGEIGWVRALFYGLQPAVIVIVALAVWKLAKRSLRGWPHWVVAALAFLAIFALGAPFPLVIALAALVGFLLPPPPEGATAAVRGLPRWHHVRVLGGWSLAIALVYFAIRLALGPDPYDAVAELFLSAALVTFGGAYAVLPYVADRAVDTYGWLSALEMLNGLALAESTPGPLILVNMYAGFFAGWPLGAGPALLTASLACFYTFAPSFALILACAPYVEALQRASLARRALAGVSAAVVGVVLNLAVYLGIESIFPAGWAAPELPKLLLLAGFGALALWRNPPMMALLGLGAAAGLLLYGAGLA